MVYNGYMRDPYCVYLMDSNGGELEYVLFCCWNIYFEINISDFTEYVIYKNEYFLLAYIGQKIV